MDTARLPPLLSRIFNIKTPGSISTTWASVVLVRAMLCIFHVLPRSLLYIIPALGIRVESINWVGKTNVPSLIVIPRPGPWSRKYQDGSFTCSVILIGSDHVLPSSVLFTIINCAVWFISIPGCELHHARWLPIPCVHAATIHTVFVFVSTKIEGSPTPFWAFGKPPYSPNERGRRIFSHVFPPSVLRLNPTSTYSCKSTLLL